MKRSLAGLVMLAAVSISGALAQPPGPPRGMGARHMDGLAKRLTLDAAQKEEATALYAAADTSARALHGSMKQAHEAMKLAIEKNDTVGIDRAALQMGTLSAQEISIRGKADAAFRQTLTTEQQATFDKIHMRGGGGTLRARPPR